MTTDVVAPEEASDAVLSVAATPDELLQEGNVNMIARDIMANIFFMLSMCHKLINIFLVAL